MKTPMAKPGDVVPQWHIVDASQEVLGRAAVRIAAILQGKHRPTWTPHVDTGDFVVVINAEKIGATGDKDTQKIYQWYTGWPSGRKTRTLAVKVPAGVDDGDRIRLSGEGEAGRNGGPAGDLYVEIRVNPHKIFERDGSNLSCEVPVSIATATLGGEVELPTLDGHVALKVPAGTQSGKVFRLRGKGVRTVRDARLGDLFAQVAVETPVT